MILYFCLGARFSGQRPRYSYLYALLKHLLSHARIKGALEHRKNGVFLRQRKMEPICSKVPVASGEFDPRNSKVKIYCHELLNSKCHANGYLCVGAPRRELLCLFKHFFDICSGVGFLALGDFFRGSLGNDCSAF